MTQNRIELTRQDLEDFLITGIVTKDGITLVTEISYPATASAGAYPQQAAVLALADVDLWAGENVA